MANAQRGYVTLLQKHIRSVTTQKMNYFFKKYQPDNIRFSGYYFTVTITAVFFTIESIFLIGGRLWDKQINQV